MQRVRDALLTTGVPVSHYQAVKKTDRYIVWAEDGWGDAVWGDGALAERAIQGTAHYFTRMEYDPTVERIEQALTEAGIPFRLGSIQFEEQTRYMHYEWIWEVC